MKQENKKSAFGITREFAMINWWVTWVALIAVAGYNYMTLEYIKTDFNKALKIMQQESKGIVMLDQLGRPSVAKRSSMSVNSPAFQQAVLNNVQNFFIWDWISLTDNYKNKIITINDLEKFNPKFKEFKNNYISPKDKKTLKQFVSFEKYIIYLLGNDKMPEMISVTDAKITSYHTDEGTFTAKLVFNQIANIYNTTAGEFSNRRGSVTVEVEGRFDSSEGGVINPLGLVYSDIKPNLLTKD